MKWIALGSLVALLASTPVEAHCFARWYYPWPQRCGVARLQIPANLRKPVTRATPEKIPNFGSGVALPILTRNDCKGGEADELTRARLELLGYAHAH
jgi:hypothetical protein